LHQRKSRFSVLNWCFAQSKRAKQTAPHDAPKRAADREVLADIWRLRLALALVGAGVVYGTLGYALIEKWPLHDALYMTVITISTVGFAEIHPLSNTGRAFTMTVILAGAGSVFYSMGVAFELLLSERFRHWRAHRKMQEEIREMRGHYIICGYGRIGQQVVDDLREADLPYLVIDSKPERWQLLQENNVPFVDGDATLDETLLEAGIEHAKAVVGALNDDASNMMMTVTARGLNPQLFIIARAALPESEKKLMRAGADDVISPYKVGARHISLAMMRPAVNNFINAVLYDSELQAEFTEKTIENDSPLVGQTLADAGLAHGRDVLLIAMLHNSKLIFAPPANTVLHAGDTLIIVVPTESLKMARV
jgi:voltage-gated potassium channel